jgi:hypothetical protein
MPAPALDNDLRLAQRVEDFAVEQFVAQARIETLDESVLPRAGRRDVRRLCPDGGDPFLHRLGNELRAIIGADVLGHTTQDEQVRQHIDNIDRFKPARDPNGQALMGELVDDVEQADFAPVMGALLEEVIGPDVVGALGPQSEA